MSARRVCISLSSGASRCARDAWIASHAPHLVREDNRPWVSRAISVGRHDGPESGSAHRQRKASRTDSGLNGLACGAVRGALVALSPFSAGRNGSVKQISLGAAVDPSIWRSVNPERRVKALGPHSERAGVAPGHARKLTSSRQSDHIRSNARLRGGVRNAAHYNPVRKSGRFVARA